MDAGPSGELGPFVGNTVVIVLLMALLEPVTYNYVPQIR